MRDPLFAAMSPLKTTINPDPVSISIELYVN